MEVRMLQNLPLNGEVYLAGTIADLPQATALVCLQRGTAQRACLPYPNRVALPTANRVVPPAEDRTGGGSDGTTSTTGLGKSDEVAAGESSRAAPSGPGIEAEPGTAGSPAAVPEGEGVFRTAFKRLVGLVVKRNSDPRKQGEQP